MRLRASSLLSPLAMLGIQLAAFLVALALFGIFLALVGADPLAVFPDMLSGAFGSRFS
ncbi:MAG: hypothetical protein JWN04_6381, partial [Myxococcaceae bacterium]|nr:hypothetical protein [Myxococcaceae bacterium]